MKEGRTAQLRKVSRENDRTTEELIAEMNEQIARIKALRICIALYLVSTLVENRKFP